MRPILILFISVLTVGYSYSQNKDSYSPEIDFFNSIEGTWEGIPKDSSFISILTYNRAKKDHFVFVNNDLLSKERKFFSHYEGVYFFNPNKARIEFTTINKSEIHSGYCITNKDTLYHYATIRNKSGKMRAYSSALIKRDDKTLVYFAVYGKDEKIPEIVFEDPLIYLKIEK